MLFQQVTNLQKQCDGLQHQVANQHEMLRLQQEMLNKQQHQLRILAKAVDVLAGTNFMGMTDAVNEEGPQDQAADAENLRQEERQ